MSEPSLLHQPTGRAALGLSLAAITMLLWGSLPLALKGALQHLDAVTLTMARFVVAAAVLVVVLVPRGELPRIGTLGRGGGLLLAFAICGLSINFMGFILGLERTSPANAQLVIQLAPLLLGLGGLALFGERYSRLQWMGVFVLVAGLLVFFQGQLGSARDDPGRYLFGTGLLVMAAITWAGYGLAQKQLLGSMSSLPLMCAIYVGCALLLLPWTTPSAIGGLTPMGWSLLAYCSVNTLVGYGAFAMALEHVEASRVAAVLALTPVATLAFSQAAAALWPDTMSMESLGLSQWVGGAAVVAGSIATTLGAARARTVLPTTSA